jgi:hypothetical protein
VYHGVGGDEEVVEHFDSYNATQGRALRLWPDDQPVGKDDEGKHISYLRVQERDATTGDWRTHDDWLA